MIPEGEGDDSSQTFLSCYELDSRVQYNNFFNNDGLKIFHSNIRSYLKNIDEMLVYLDQLPQLDIIVFTECWLGRGERGVAIEGYDIVLTDKQRNQNDGIVIYVNKRLPASVAQVTLGDVYGISLDFRLCNIKFNLLAVYRTFDCNCVDFIKNLELYYDKTCRDSMCILVGDTNIDTLQNNFITDTYLNCLLGSGMIECINKPTRVTSHSSTCIDHIFVKYFDIDNVKSAVLHTNVTDHFSTALVIKTPHTDKITDKNLITYIDKSLVTDGLAHLDWAPILNSFDVNRCTNLFCNSIKNVMREATKQIPNRPRLKKLKPWITHELILLIRKRDHLSKKLKKQPFNLGLKNEFRLHRQLLSNSLKNTKREYYRSKITEFNGNPKMFWSIINELAGRPNPKDRFPLEKFILDNNNYSTGPEMAKDIANGFNNFFASVGQNLASSITVSGDPVLNDENYRLDTDFTFNTVTGLDVRRYVSSLRGGSAPGHDGVSANILKHNIDFFLNPLLHLINLSLTTGTFPDSFKLAKVFPLYKSNDIRDKNNFRPISLLSVFSKVIEKIVKDQLVNYINKNNILSDCQFGFRNDKNISDALFDICSLINNSISNNKKTMLIFLDLKKAFDSVDRNKLLHKLKLIGIRGLAYKWFESYLSDRQQFVSISGTNSDLLTVDYGVIQGSTLGPILFLVYINNISKLETNGKIRLFADDTLIFLQGNDWADVREQALHDMMILKKWLNFNTLSLNTSKSKFMAISLRNNTDYLLENIIIHECGNYLNSNCTCEAIEKVNYYKYLGVLFDSRMKWSEHIQFLKTKLRKFIFVFKQLNEILNPNEIKLAYYAYVQSFLSFGIIAWGGAFKSILQPLNTVLNTILKVGFKKDRRHPTELLFSEIGILSIRQIYVKTLLLHIYKNYETLFPTVTHSHDTRYSRNTGIVTLQLHKTFSSTNCFYVSHVLFRNIMHRFSNRISFVTRSTYSFKACVKRLLCELGVEGAETIIVANYGRT